MPKKVFEHCVFVQQRKKLNNELYLLEVLSVNIKKGPSIVLSRSQC